jgi:hypothetical protein
MRRPLSALIPAWVFLLRQIAAELTGARVEMASYAGLHSYFPAPASRNFWISLA